VCFFVGITWLVADIFARGANGDDVLANQGNRWRDKAAAAVIALLAAWMVMAGMCQTLPQSAGVVAAALALMALVPALGIVPYVMTLVGDRYVAVVFSLTAVACMKLLGCLVVVLIHGWDASERGYTTMPWTEPNLLVGLFVSFTAVPSAACFGLVVRRSSQGPQAAFAGTIP
jgi:hypothetical protein